MHRNPLKRGLLLEPEQWQWSSYRSYADHEQGRVKINQWRKAPDEASPVSCRTFIDRGHSLCA
jgi:hypothetical protein